MTKKNRFDSDFAIKNIENQTSQRNLDGIDQAPFWFNTPPPMIRGGDKTSGAYLGKEPSEFVFPIPQDFEAGATAFIYAYDDGFTLNEFSSESIGAPTGSKDGIFGVYGAADTDNNWRGFLRSTGSSEVACYDPRCTRIPTTGELVIAYSFRHGHQIIAADGTTVLATVSTPASITQEVCIAVLASDGQSLTVSPKIYTFASSPTPPSTGLVTTWALTANDDNIVPTMVFSLGGDTADGSGLNEIIDLDGEATHTFPDHDNIGTSNYASIHATVRLSALGVYEGHVGNTNSPNVGYYSPQAAECDYDKISDQAFVGYGNDFPRKGYQNTISPDGTYFVTPVMWEPVTSVGLDSGIGFPTFGSGSGGEFTVELIGNRTDSFFGGGLKAPMAGTLPVPDWFVGNATDNSSETPAPASDTRTWTSAFTSDTTGIYGHSMIMNSSNDYQSGSFQRYPTNYSNREGVGGAYNSQAVIWKMDTDGNITWSKTIQTGDVSAGSDQFALDPKGLVVVDDEIHQVLSVIDPPTSLDVFNIDPSSGNWSPSIALNLIPAGSLVFVTWNADTGAFVRARLLMFQRTDSPGTGIFLRSPRQLNYDPVSGKVKIGAWLDNLISGIHPTSFRVDNGTSVSNISGGPTTGELGADQEHFYEIGYDVSTGDVSIVTELASGPSGFFDDQRGFDMRASSGD